MTHKELDNNTVLRWARTEFYNRDAVNKRFEQLCDEYIASTRVERIELEAQKLFDAWKDTQNA